MTESGDWKQKYRDALVEAEGESQRWRQTEQALRRLVGRLCAAGMGVAPALDDELIALAAANRRNADAQELERLAASLTTAVVAVDAVAPVPTIIWDLPAVVSRWDSTCAAVSAVLLNLKSADPDNPVADALIAEVPGAKTDAELATVVGRTADLVEAQAESASRERLASTAVLADVTQRLEEITGYLTETDAASESRFADGASLNTGVLAAVREMSAEIDAATELAALQQGVRTRLARVTEQIVEFRERELDRSQRHRGLAGRMHERIADLERETHELHAKLAQEKQGARRDPLTRLANRRAFDERFVEAIGRRAQDGLPLTMLLWDLDHFKVINDSYGHRAGDRVLQTLANCFKSSARAEDFVARIGGEEFVMILPGLAVDRGLAFADAVRTTVEGLRLHFRGTPVRLTVSCGVTELRSEDTPGTAFDRADAALYQAKRAGKNCCICG